MKLCFDYTYELLWLNINNLIAYTDGYEKTQTEREIYLFILSY